MNSKYSQIRVIPNSTVRKMAFADCDRLFIDCSLPKNRIILNHIPEFFKQTSPKLNRLMLKNGETQIFPVKIIDSYLRKHPEKAKNVTHLSLMFDPCNSVQLLKMVSSRYPKMERLQMNFADNHPIEHALTHWACMPNLVEIHLQFSLINLYQFICAHPFAPFTKMKIVHCEIVSCKDTYDHFEATIPVLFPNLVQLDISCPTQAFTDRVQEKVRTLFPKLKKCYALDSEDVLIQE